MGIGRRYLLVSSLLMFFIVFGAAPAAAGAASVPPKFSEQRKFIGQEFDSGTKLDYLNARYYNPTIGKFISQDPLTRDNPEQFLTDPQQLNSYSYARNNPINASDPTGLIPSAKEAAIMASQIYNNGSEGKNLIGGWQYNSSLPGSGAKTGIYSRVKEDKSTEYALVGRGTSSLSDWVNNGQQIFGASPDMSASVEKATGFVNSHKDNEVTFVGHSKAGTEAAADAIATNKNAIIFNPATLNASAYRSKISQYTAHVYEYIVKGEPLNSIFGILSTTFGSHDSVTYLPAQRSLSSLGRLLLGPTVSSAIDVYNSYRNHSMSSVISGLNK